MGETAGLAHPEIQTQLLAEAVASASVGFLVWDDQRRYIAANRAACEILGTTLEELLGQEVAGHTPDGEGPLEAALHHGFAQGVIEVDRFDGSGRIRVHYCTFRTLTARMPYMATLIAPVGDN